MAERNHTVVRHLHEETKRFSVTARKPSARLAGVDKQMADAGYKRIVVADRLTKENAEELRDRDRAEWEGKGYTYQTRPGLPEPL
jgi:hypothetical protein